MLCADKFFSGPLSLSADSAFLTCVILCGFFVTWNVIRIRCIWRRRFYSRHRQVCCRWCGWSCMSRGCDRWRNLIPWWLVDQTTSSELSFSAALEHQQAAHHDPTLLKRFLQQSFSARHPHHQTLTKHYHHYGLLSALHMAQFSLVLCALKLARSSSCVTMGFALPLVFLLLYTSWPSCTATLKLTLKKKSTRDLCNGLKNYSVRGDTQWHTADASPIPCTW